MADARVRASFVPKTTSADIDALAVLIDAVAGTDTVVVDRGLDKVVTVDVIIDDPVLATAQAVVPAILGAVANAALFSQLDEFDPTLNAPSNVSLDISDGNVAFITWIATLSPGAKIASITVAGDAPGIVPVEIRGDPRGHESQKLGEPMVIAKVGPAGTGDEVGTPHQLTLTITDTNGRVSAVDSVDIAVTT